MKRFREPIPSTFKNVRFPFILLGRFLSFLKAILVVEMAKKEFEFDSFYKGRWEGVSGLMSWNYESHLKKVKRKSWLVFGKSLPNTESIRPQMNYNISAFQRGIFST